MEIHDQLYLQITEANSFMSRIWEPQGIAVVIGHAQRAELEVQSDACRRDGVAVIRRRGGGGAVVLLPGVLCLTCAFISRQSDSPYHFFRQINTFLINLLSARFGVTGLRLAGISDIALGDKKILGCSMFKSRALFFYQGSLLLHPDLARIGRYLSHPSREPDYRQGRDHGDFITSLWEQGHRIPLAGLAAAMTAALPQLRDLLLAAPAPKNDQSCFS